MARLRQNGREEGMRTHSRRIEVAVSEKIYCGEQGKTGQNRDFEGGRLPELRKKGEMVGKGFQWWSIAGDGRIFFFFNKKKLGSTADKTGLFASYSSPQRPPAVPTGYRYVTLSLKGRTSSRYRHFPVPISVYISLWTIQAEVGYICRLQSKTRPTEPGFKKSDVFVVLD